MFSSSLAYTPFSLTSAIARTSGNSRNKFWYNHIAVTDFFKNALPSFEVWQIKDHPRIDILLENADFGVGEINE